MEQPTQEQIKELWERCGFKLSKTKSPDPIYELLKPNGEQYDIWYAWRGTTSDKFDGDAIRSIYPPIDLNNLFKYAVPNVMEYYKSQSTPGYLQTANYLMENWIGDWVDSDNGYDPALALFWAIWEVHKEV